MHKITKSMEFSLNRIINIEKKLQENGVTNSEFSGFHTSETI